MKIRLVHEEEKPCSAVSQDRLASGLKAPVDGRRLIR
jgi:hypothetical protein